MTTLIVYDTLPFNSQIPFPSLNQRITWQQQTRRTRGHMEARPQRQAEQMPGDGREIWIHVSGYS